MSIEDKFPMLRIELQAAKLTLLQALNNRHDDLQKMIQQSFENAILHIGTQLDTQVQRALSEVISQSVEQAAKIAAEGLAEELADSMSKQVRDIVAKRMKGSK